MVIKEMTATRIATRRRKSNLNYLEGVYLYDLNRNKITSNQLLPLREIKRMTPFIHSFSPEIISTSTNIQFNQIEPYPVDNSAKKIEQMPLAHTSVNAIRQKVGIVIVSHNASLAVRITLASLHKAANETPFELILVDNASDKDERKEIEKAFTNHRNEIGAAWKIILLDENKGFAGGNNIGIKEFLRDETISHICLLNSDVIVTNYWIDRLVSKKCNIILPLTNRADSTQRIPIDFNLADPNFLMLDDEQISDQAFIKVNRFAQELYNAWKGNIAKPENDTTFFCVLLSREIITSLGFLDEKFFPGGYEDNDYCERARNKGFKIYHARDTFIYHFGSSSFGKLSRNYFLEVKKKNLSYFEQKHSKKITTQYSYAILSFSEDLNFLKNSENWNSLQQKFIENHLEEITKLIEHVKEEHSKLTNLANGFGEKLPDSLRNNFKNDKELESVLESWLDISKDMKMKLSTSSYTKSNLEAFQKTLLEFSGIVDRITKTNIEIVKTHEELKKEIMTQKNFLSISGLLPAKAIRFIKHINYKIKENSKIYRKILGKLKAVRQWFFNHLKSSRSANTNDYEILEKASSIDCDILVQVDNFLSGGLENAVLGINKTLMDKDYAVNLLILGNSGPAVEKAIKNGTTIHKVKFQPDLYEKLLSVLSPQLVISHYSIEGSKICNNLDIPLIQVIHNIYMWFTEKQLFQFKESIENTNIFIAGSNLAKSYSIERLEVPAEKCFVIPYGIDVQKIWSVEQEQTRNTLRKELDFSDEDFIFLSVAAINHQKNHLGLIEAFRKALPHCPNAKLVLLGPTYEKEILYKLENFIDDNKLNDQILYLGNLAEPYKYYFMADAFIHPAFFEGGPLVLLEAIASNLPIISTKVGLAECFSNNQGINLLPPPIDIFNYYGSISNLHSNADFEEDLSQEIQKTYHDPVKPNISRDIIRLMDNSIVYMNYYQVIEQVIQHGEIKEKDNITSWLKYFENKKP